MTLASNWDFKECSWSWSFRFAEASNILQLLLIWRDHSTIVRRLRKIGLIETEEINRFIINNVTSLNLTIEIKNWLFLLLSNLAMNVFVNIYGLLIVVKEVRFFRWWLYLWLIAERRSSWLRKVARERATSKLAPILTLRFEATLFLSLSSCNVYFYRLSRTTKFWSVSFYIFDLVFVVSKSSRGFLLVIQMRKDFIITPQLEILSLLNTVHWVSIKSERVLEGHVWR